jgi:ribosomal protein S12 methylthiotransferase
VKIGFVSLGCAKNLVDGEVMLGLARQAGHEITADAADAEVVVVNTCAFIDAAKEESVDAILEMADLKRNGACRRLVVTGCLAERYRDQLRAEIPEIDAVLGTGDVPDIVRAIGSSAGLKPGPPSVPAGLKPGPPSVPAGLKPGPPSVSAGLKSGQTPALPRPPAASPVRLFKSARELAGTSAGTAVVEHGPKSITYLYDASTPRLQTTPRHYAYVKVAEGCDYTCAFCIIPTLRGAYRSRDIASIVTEARALAANGVRELILISQDTTFFGRDRNERGALARLLRQLNAVDGLAWIRLLYLYPTTITDDVLDAMAECEKVCRYVDLPLQHASSRVLARMRRPGNRQTYDKLLARVRSRVPGVALRTTFIVGFPGETDADVDELASFIDDAAFDQLGIFTYSHEEDTRAFALADDVPPAVKTSRRARLMALQAAGAERRLRNRIGETVQILVDGAAPDDPLVVSGRLESQAPDIDGSVVLSAFDPDVAQPGAFVTGRIIGVAGYDLVAAPLPLPD